MKKQSDCDTLLIVVGSEGQAGAVVTALSVRGIVTLVRRDMTKVIEFGSTLGVHPIEMYVPREDLLVARKILEAEGVPHGPGPGGVGSEFRAGRRPAE